VSSRTGLSTCLYCNASLQLAWRLARRSRYVRLSMGLKMLSASAFAEKSQRAQLAFDAGQIADAEQLCLEIVAADPNDFEAARLLGIAQHRRGQSQEAVASYDKALAIRPGNADVLYNRGMALIWLKRFPEALASIGEL